VNTASFRANFSILLLAFLTGCAGSRQHSLGDSINRSTRIDNLRKAVQLPWVDDGSCAVREALNEWPVVVERCFYALDLQKIRFAVSTGKCAVASADVTALGKCLLAAVPAVETPLAGTSLVGARLAALPGAAALPLLAPAAPVAAPVIIAAGVVVVGVVAAILIVEAIEYYQENKPMRRTAPETEASREVESTASQPRSSMQDEAAKKGRPELKPDSTPRVGPAPSAPEDKEKQSGDVWVVRAGVTTSRQLQDGVAEHSKIPGLIGFSVQSAPGKTIEELAAAGEFRNKQISVTTVRALKLVGVLVVPSPGKGYHNTAVTPMPLSDPQAAAISTLFHQRPNPGPAR